ncbi:hypothetical protein D9611_000781 [Ephemerocybe angulata]|uniref:ABC1 atypical kinase-like domain-containing protein n=1 Tax=Ephemerocybe angulata TaxID=980116 RepID=A0A8H5BPE6_9AGAR|nr:hypothetical protein D9611_000781 [Tulosesus angulatus]
MSRPSGTYNALCVLYSLSQVLGHAAKHRAAQASHTAAGGAIKVVLDAATRTSASTAPPSSTIASAEPSTSKPVAAELRRVKQRREREIEDEEFRKVLNTRWEDRNPQESRVSKPFNFHLNMGSENSGTSGTLNGFIRTNDLTSDVVEVEGEVQFKMQLKVPQEMALEPIVPQESAKVDEPIPPYPTLESPAEAFQEPTTLAPSTFTTPPPSPPTTDTTTETSPLLIPATNDTTEIITNQRPLRTLQSSKVPSSRIGRLFHYGGLAASLSYGAAAELIRRGTGTTDEASSSLMLTEANVKRLVGKLSQMRGAALKLGQFMSIQDTHVLPPELDEIFRRVQDGAHYMPDWQMEKVLSTSFGPNWCNPDKPDETVFLSFDRVPFAAASIGQVHRAVLAPRHLPPGVGDPEYGLEVAVKVQFPNIANSITSDLGYVKMLLTAGRLLPKGLFLDRTIEVMSAELADECSYTREASFLQKFASPEYLGADPRFKVPWVWQGSSDTVLVMERVGGVGVGDVSSGEIGERLSQEDRNSIAEGIVELCLKELFEFRTMQTDPNWTNFLWNAETRQIELVDFGATRTYSKQFMDGWLSLLQAAASGNKEASVEWSIKLGYLTGKENEIMVNAHVHSMTLLATPFRTDTPQPFSFGPTSQWAQITKEIRDQIPIMLAHRLTPPPRETYSLNRKLSGAFLLASRLGAEVNTRRVWEKVVGSYKFGPIQSKVGENGLEDVD